MECIQVSTLNLWSLLFAKYKRSKRPLLCSYLANDSSESLTPASIQNWIQQLQTPPKTSYTSFAFDRSPAPLDNNSMPLSNTPPRHSKRRHYQTHPSPQHLLFQPQQLAAQPGRILNLSITTAYALPIAMKLPLIYPQR